MANFNHKVGNTYRWISHLPYIQFCEDTAELESLFKQIDIDESYRYDPTQFDQYWQLIQSQLARHGK
jgi:hypothetical protein